MDHLAEMVSQDRLETMVIQASLASQDHEDPQEIEEQMVVMDCQAHGATLVRMACQAGQDYRD